MKIHYLNGPQAGRRIELSAEGTTIGREQDNQIQLLIGGVSRYHAKIENKDGSWFLRDLGSTNGTKINEILITESTKLNHGDHVVIGDQQFRIDIPHRPVGVIEYGQRFGIGLLHDLAGDRQRAAFADLIHRVFLVDQIQMQLAEPFRIFFKSAVNKSSALIVKNLSPFLRVQIRETAPNCKQYAFFK